MKHNILSAYAAVALMLSVTSTVPAQSHSYLPTKLTVADSTKLRVLTLKDGSKAVGRVTAIHSDTVVLTSAMGELALQAQNIRSVRDITAGAMHGDEYWFPNPNSTRLFFAPTGQMLKKGEGYFADYELFLPGFAYGLTDNVTIGGGVSILPLAADEQLYFLTPKVGGRLSENVHLAGGVLFAGSKLGTGGIGYGTGTFGNSDGSVTVAGGYGFAGGEIASKPLLMVGAEKRVARRLALVTENYLPPTKESKFVYSFGVRLMGEKLTTDLALVNVHGSGIIGLPFVDFVFKF
jgi:hypothetical protein